MLNFLQTYAINIKHGFINSITEIIFNDRYLFQFIKFSLLEHLILITK